MKKLFVVLSMLLVFSLVLTACAAGDNNQNNQTPVPGAEFDATATVALDDVVETPVVEPTVTEVFEVVETPVVDTPVVEPTADTAAVNPTADPGMPVTGDDDCNPYRLHGLLDMDVFDANGEQIGDVDEVIVYRDANAVAPEAGSMPVTGVAPRIAYVVIDLENNDDELLVPFGAFDMTAYDRDVAATTDGTATDLANEFDTCAVVLSNTYTADAFANAPLWDDDVDFIDGWDVEYRTYWTGLGHTFNDANFANLGNPLVLGDSFDDIDARNFNGEDLGEVEDFVINLQDGTFEYAILATGGFLGIGERYVAVPMERVTWVIDDAGDLNDPGYIVINMADDAWENAPAFDNLDDVDFRVRGWDDDIRNFWNNLTN